MFGELGTLANEGDQLLLLTLTDERSIEGKQPGVAVIEEVKRASDQVDQDELLLAELVAPA